MSIIIKKEEFSSFMDFLRFCRAYEIKVAGHWDILQKNGELEIFYC